MSISYQFSPVVFSFKNRMRAELKGNQYKIMDTIADEVFLFEDTRLTLTKELSTRYIASKTGICQPNVARAINRLEKKNFIRSIKSHVKGEGSLITIILDSTSISGNLPSDIKTISDNKKSDSTLLSNQENLSRKKDLQESDHDPFLNIEEKEKTIEEKLMENSSDCFSAVEGNQASPEVNFQNKPALNLLCPRPGAGAPSKVEFSSLASVLPALISAPSPQQDLSAPIGAPVTAPPITGIKPAIVEKGKTILQEKGFTAQQVQAITQRITDSIIKNKPIKPEGYFITAIKNEKIKTAVTSKNTSPCSTAPSSQQIPPGTGIGAMVQVQKRNSFTETVNRWEEEKKNDINPEVVIKKLMASRPEDLYQVILHVDNSPAGKFISLPEIKASLYIAEFKKRFPEVTI